MTRRSVFLMVTAWICTCAAAQRRVVVRDMETLTPLKDVQVFVDGKTDRRLVTDYKGEFEIPDTIRSLLLCHKQYERRLLDSCEIGDTIDLLPNMNKMDEVIVWGHRHPQISPDIMGMSQSIKAEMAGMPKPSGMDFLSIFEWKKKKKQRKRKEAIENY